MFKNLLKKKIGFISVELVVIAAIALVSGFTAIGSFVEDGQRASNDAASKIDETLNLANNGSESGLPGFGPGQGNIETAALEGDGQTFYKVAPSTLTFRSTEPIDEFVEVQVNGQTVDPEYYTVTEGSTIVTLKVDYLHTLGESSYDIAVVSENKIGTGEFNVDEGDWNSEVGFWYNKPYVYAGWGGGYGIMFNEDDTMYVVFFDLSSNVYDISKHPYSIQDGKVVASINGDTYIAKGTEDENILDAYIEGYPEDIMQFWHYELACISEGEYFYAEPWAAWLGSADSYDAQVLDRDKTHYQPIQTGVNGLIVETNGTYRDCVNLLEIAIPYGITFIGDDCFENCESLVKVTIPKSVTEIYGTAFTNCTSLTTIEFKGTMDDWNKITKRNGWNKDLSSLEIVCTDGIITMN